MASDETNSAPEEGSADPEGEGPTPDDPGSYAPVHARPDGDSTVARLALTASEYGYDGIVVRNHGDAPAAFDRDAVADTYDLDVVEGVEVRADDPGRASGFVGNHRQDRVVVAVHGGSEAINRFAVEQPAVDVLAHPLRGDGTFDHVLAAEAAENGVRVEVSLRDVLSERGGRRVRRLQDLRRLREVIEAYDVPYVVGADPRSHLAMRAPRELAAVGEAVGFERAAIDEGLREWGRIARRNRERLSDAFVAPGVRLDDEE